MLVFLSFKANAQRAKVLNLPKYDEKVAHFGFTLGINSTNFILEPDPEIKSFDSIYSVEPVAQPGFNLGIVSNLRLGKYFDFRFVPALSFAERIIEYRIRAKDSITMTAKKVESTFIDFPINIKFKSARVNNGRAYILAGAKYTFDLASQKHVKIPSTPGKEIIKLKTHDVSYEIGFGIDFYTQYFKFSPELKFSVGLNNLLIPEDKNPYSLVIERLTSKILLLSFNFE